MRITIIAGEILLFRLQFCYRSTRVCVIDRSVLAAAMISGRNVKGIRDCRSDRKGENRNRLDR